MVSHVSLASLSWNEAESPSFRLNTRAATRGRAPAIYPRAMVQPEGRLDLRTDESSEAAEAESDRTTTSPASPGHFLYQSRAPAGAQAESTGESVADECRFDFRFPDRATGI
jgi:hypothetical protein